MNTDTDHHVPGVHLRGKRWYVKVNFDRRQIYGGTFGTREDAEAAAIALRAKLLAQSQAEEPTPRAEPRPAPNERATPAAPGVYWSPGDQVWVVQLVHEGALHFGGRFERHRLLDANNAADRLRKQLRPDEPATERRAPKPVALIWWRPDLVAQWSWHESKAEAALASGLLDAGDYIIIDAGATAAAARELAPAYDETELVCDVQP